MISKKEEEFLKEVFIYHRAPTYVDKIFQGYGIQPISKNPQN